MSLSQKHKSMMAAAESLRLVYGPNAAKKIARSFNVAVVTAKLWLAGRAPTSREKEIAAALLAECLRLEAQIAEIRATWQGVGDAEEGGAVARGKVHSDGAQAGGVGGKSGLRR